MSDEKKSIWPMTDVQIAAIRERCDKATPPPWVASEYANCVYLGYKPDHERTWGYGCGNSFVCDLNDGEYHNYCNESEQLANAEFIAHAREDVPALLAEVERLQKVVRLAELYRKTEKQELLAEVERLEDEVACLEQELKFSDETEYELIKKLFDLKICHKETICEQADAQELNFEGESGCLFCWRQWAIRKAREAESEGE